MNPLSPFIDQQGIVVLDGGLATELENCGCDLSDDLWSARLLADDPDLIREVHLAYYRAGADIATSASYQATVPGFMKAGIAEADARKLLLLSVKLAREARDIFWAEDVNRRHRIRPLVAASIGPYGAYLADGSEYTGRYNLSPEDLADFHRDRWAMLKAGQPDLMACESLPSFGEAQILADLLENTPDNYAWFSFTCPDERHISDGTPIAECAAFLDGIERVAAVGINCTAPRFLPGLIEEIAAVSDKPILAYPNSGEQYDAVQGRWLGQSVPAEFGTYSREWRKLGAAVMGGCCRTTPAHIQQIADRIPFRRGV